MGYTHYYRKEKELEKEQNWHNFVNDVEKLLTFCQKELKIKLQSNHPSQKMIGEQKDYINFNGVNDESCETFEVKINDKIGFSFTKTRNKPYDLAVCSTLLLLNYHMPKLYNISSDGDSSNWNDAIKINHQLFGYAFELPYRVSLRPEEEELISSLKASQEKKTIEEEVEQSNFNKKIAVL